MLKKAKKTEEEKEEKINDLKETIEELRHKFGEGSIMTLKDVKASDVDAISTGSISLDSALGVGGMPRGRIIEIYGSESTGKTTLALHVIAEAQKKGGICAFVDVEHALDPEYTKKIGVKIEDLLISQPDSGEEALQIIESLIKSQKIDVVVLDSVAALVPKDEVDGEMGSFKIGLQARLMSHALRKLTSFLSKSKTIAIFLNQTRIKIGQMFGNPETTTGGLALKFYASVRIQLTRIGQIKRGEEIVGNRILAKVVKNKVAPPFRTAEFDIYYNEGISVYSDILNLAVKNNIIKKSGSWFEFEEQKIGQGIEAARDFLKQNPIVLNKIRKTILDSQKIKKE